MCIEDVPEEIVLVQYGTLLQIRRQILKYPLRRKLFRIDIAKVNDIGAIRGCDRIVERGRCHL